MYWRASAIIWPQAAWSALTLMPKNDRIASTTTAIPISRLSRVISKGMVAGKISRIIVRPWEKPSRRAAERLCSNI